MVGINIKVIYEIIKMSGFRSRFLKEIWKWTVAFLLTVIIPLQRLYYFDQELATHLRRHPRPHKVNIFN